MVMKYGIVQGRLVPQVGSFIQNFPIQWKDEFRIAKDVGASHIEWIITPTSNQRTNPTNPIFQDKSVIPSDVPISGVCMDDLIDPHFADRDYRRQHLMDAFCVSHLMGVGRVILPLLEKASVRDTSVRREMLYDIADAHERWPVMISLETDLDASNLRSFVRALGVDKCWVTLDSGNLVRLGFDLTAYIRDTMGYVDGIHIKDISKRSNQTVQLGTGDVDLKMLRPAFQQDTLRWITFQTARSPGDEIETFRHNVRTVEASCF